MPGRRGATKPHAPCAVCHAWSGAAVAEVIPEGRKYLFGGRARSIKVIRLGAYDGKNNATGFEHALYVRLAETTAETKIRLLLKRIETMRITSVRDGFELGEGNIEADATVNHVCTSGRSVVL